MAWIHVCACVCVAVLKGVDGVDDVGSRVVCGAALWRWRASYQLQSVSESEGAHVWVSHSAPTVSCPTRTAVENGYPENMQERENANAGPHSITSHFIPAVQIVNRKNVSTAQPRNRTQRKTELFCFAGFLHSS